MLNKLLKQLSDKSEVYLKIKVKTGSVKTEINEIMDDGCLKINLKEKPIKGRANQELINFLSKTFGCQKENIKILSGISDRTKLIKIIK
jgi:uncharacterized protein